VVLLQEMAREDVMCIEAKHLAQLMPKIKDMMTHKANEGRTLEEMAKVAAKKKLCNAQTATLLIKTLRLKDTFVHSVFSIVVFGAHRGNANEHSGPTFGKYVKESVPNSITAVLEPKVVIAVHLKGTTPTGRRRVSAAIHFSPGNGG
jgi:hypothetical protein